MGHQKGDTSGDSDHLKREANQIIQKLWSLTLKIKGKPNSN